MKEAPANPRQDHTRPRPGGSDWQRTLWAIVGIQFVMRAGVNFLSPITPLSCRNWVSDQRKASIFGRASSQVPRLSTPPLPRRSGAVSPTATGANCRCCAPVLRSRVFTGLMGLSTNVWQFFGARAVTGAFAGFSSAAIALVASQVPERRLGHPLGWLASGQLVGSLIGQSSAVCWPMSPAAIVPRFSGVPALPAPAWHWSGPW